MSAGTEARRVNRVRAEQVAMDALADRLAKQFPELAAEEIIRAIRGQYEGFDDSPIRDFIPVLVERRVRADLGSAPQYRA